MKAIITVPFRDKYDTSIVHRVGDVVDFDVERVQNLSARGLVQPIEEPPVKEVVDKPADLEVNDTSKETQNEVEGVEKPKSSRKGRKKSTETEEKINND